MQQFHNAQFQQGEQNALMSMGSVCYDVEFVGGPLDGTNPVHPMQNSRLQIEGESGYYQYLADCRYHWIPAQ